MFRTSPHPVPALDERQGAGHDVRHDDETVTARPQVPTPTYLSSGPRPTVDAAMAALSDALERTLQEDLAQGMVPLVEHLAVDVVTEDRHAGASHVAVALVLLSYRRAS
ncbi:hypothetical protein [Cellulosimicrobium sp. Marseille-Q8652]